MEIIQLSLNHIIYRKEKNKYEEFNNNYLYDNIQKGRR